VRELEAARDQSLATLHDPEKPAFDKGMARLHVGVYQSLLDAYPNGTMSYPAEVQVIHIGPLRIVGIPGELFMALGQRIMDDADGGLVMVAGYANDWMGYFPQRAAYGDPRFAYPTQYAPLICGRFQFEPGVGERLVDAAIQQCR
jgi:hypothetical protein